MKKIFFYFVCFSISFQGYAQSSGLSDVDKARQRQKSHILKLLDEQFKERTVEKPTGTRQRVIAQTATNDGIWDSVAYKYSGTKGSRFNYNMFTYNEVLNTGWLPSYVTPHTLMPLDVLADTITQFENGLITDKDFGIYRTDNQLTFIQSEMGAWSLPNDRYSVVTTYDPLHRPEVYYFSYYSSSGPADTSSMLKYTYNAIGKVSIDSGWIKEGANWILDGVSRYYFDIGGKLIYDSLFVASIPGFGCQRVRFYNYHPDGKLETIRSTVFSENETVVKEVDSLGYTSNIPYTTFWEHRWTVVVSGNTVINREVRYPNPATGLPDSARTAIIGPSTHAERVCRYEYNSFQNPEKITFYSVNNPNGTPYNAIRFYYETYDDGVTVAELKRERDITVFPNPFNDRIIISGMISSQNFKAQLFNILGEEVFIDEFTAHSKDIVLNLADLVPGCYILLLKNEVGYVWSKKLIKK